MACFSEKANVGIALVAMVSAAGLATATAETVIVAVAAVGAVVAAAAAYIKACYDLGTCLGNAGQTDAAAKMNAHAAQEDQDSAALKQKYGL